MAKPLALALVKADWNMMSNMIMDPIDTFDTVASEAKSMLLRFGGTMMVIAPEYFLNTRGTDVSKPEAMSRSSKHSTYRTLERISRGLGNTILVAGTIFYKKGMRTKKALNVCPILRSGALIYKYYKAMDDGSAKANNSAWDYKNTGPLFTCDSIHFGLEVCGDMMDSDAEKRNWGGGGGAGAGSIEVHILIADGAGLIPSKIKAGAGGYAVLTNLKDGTTQVLKSASGKWSGNPKPYVTVKPDETAESVATGAKIEAYNLSVG